VDDAEVEPGVRQLGRLRLDLLELGHPGLGLPGLEQRQTVVEPLARRAGGELERLAQLLDRLVLGGRVLVERLAEVAVVPDPLGELGGGLGGCRRLLFYGC
jgi:hypothetical protein